jgi:hypothetical protein
MSFAETTNLSTLASGINNVIAEIDAVVISGGNTPNSSLTNQFLPSLNALYANNYDLVVDSNAKLDLWCQAVAGQYKRVLIRAGAWTASALSPTAGVLINLDQTGTTYVFAEKGSSINYSGSYAGNMYGLYHATAPTDMSAERFDNVKINITNTGTGTGYGFINCTNLTNCTCTGTSTGTGCGFASCTNLTNCTGTGTGTSTGTGNGYGFISCTNLTNCTGTGTGTGNGTSYGYGFSNCTNLTNCTGTGTGTSTGTGIGYGFLNCTNLTNCTGTGTGTSNGAGYGYGFYACTGVILCAGQGLSSSGTGYGFYSCHKMQQNKPSGASKTSTYSASYADSGSTNACADTAAGGYNS